MPPGKSGSGAGTTRTGKKMDLVNGNRAELEGTHCGTGTTLRFTRLGYLLSTALFITAVLLAGFGNTIFNLVLPQNAATFAVVLMFLFSLRLRFTVAPYLIYFYGYVAVNSFVLNFNPATFPSSFTHFVAVILFSFTLYTYVSRYKGRLLKLMHVYYYLSFSIACFAIAQVLTFVLGGPSLVLQQMLNGPTNSASLNAEVFDLLPRAIGIFSEPATFVAFLLPAVYLSMVVLSGKGRPLRLNSKLVALTIVTALALTFSFMAFLGVSLALVVINAGLLRKNALLSATYTVVSLVALLLIYLSVPQFQSRVATFALGNGSYTDYNFKSQDLSGFALISNAYVTKSSLVDSHFLGTGINTHMFSYDKYLYSFFSASQVLLELNREDAGSLYLRLASELGLPALILLFLFMYKYKIKSGTEQLTAYAMINNASFIFILLYCARNGQYVDVTLWFFISIYYHSFKLNKPIPAFVATDSTTVAALS
jgi:O-antigen ligase